MNYKNYRFLTLEEMEGRFEKNEYGSFMCGSPHFVKYMYHLLGQKINEVDAEFVLNNKDKVNYKLTSDIDGHLEWIYTPEMITNEPLPIKDDVLEYFENTPKEEISKDWEEFKDDDKVGQTIYQFNLEQSIKQLKEVAEKLNLKVSITFE